LSPAISEDRIFEASADTLIEEKEIIVVVRENGVSFKLPTTRRLAECFGVPNYCILPFFSALEDKKLLGILEDKGAEGILGRKLLDVLIERVMPL
jgi:hypothetical protein